MFNSLCKKCSWRSTDSGLLALRIGVGAIFIFTGWMKVSDLTATVGFFATMGFAPFWAYLVSFVELIGGIAVLLGVYTRIASKLLTIIMIVAIYVLRDNVQMVMTPVSVFFSTLALTLAGGGKHSLLRKCCGAGSCCGSGETSEKKCCGGGTCDTH